MKQGSSAQMTGVDPYPDFTARQDFLVDEDPHWFVGHMAKALVTIPKEIERADVVLEAPGVVRSFAARKW